MSFQKTSTFQLAQRANMKQTPSIEANCLSHHLTKDITSLAIPNCSANYNELTSVDSAESQITIPPNRNIDAFYIHLGQHQLSNLL